MLKKIFIPLGYIIFIGAVILYFVSCSASGGDLPEGGDIDGGSGGGNTGDKVTGLKASILEYHDKILLKWDSIDDAVSYKIYRYTSKNDNTPAVLTSITTEYSDNSSYISPNIPYFYKISFIKNDTESTTSDLAFGVFDTNVDNFEYNNKIENASLIANDNQNMFLDAYIYYYPNVGGYPEFETDWYRYHGTPDNFFVNVKTSDDAIFNSENVKLLFRYYYGTSKKEITCPIKKDEITACEYGNPKAEYYPDNPDEEEIVDVYFKIFIDLDSSSLPTENTKVKYEFELETLF